MKLSDLFNSNANILSDTPLKFLEVKQIAWWNIMGFPVFV